MRLVPLLLALAALTWPSIASADSDGYFCAGPGYLAYELRFSHGARAHELHIIRFSKAGGITRLAPIPLEDFQVHGMECGASEVVVHAAAKTHTVNLVAPGGPVVSVRNAPPMSQRRVESANLGHRSRPGVTDLASDAPGEFQLVIARVSKPLQGGVEHYTHAMVIRREPGPGAERFLQSLTVFQGIFLETVD